MHEKSLAEKPENDHNANDASISKQTLAAGNNSDSNCYYYYLRSSSVTLWSENNGYLKIKKDCVRAAILEHKQKKEER